MEFLPSPEWSVNNQADASQGYPRRSLKTPASFQRGQLRLLGEDLGSEHTPWDVPAQLTLACGTGNTEPLFLFPEPGIPSLNAEQTERIFPLISTGKKGGRGGLSAFVFPFLF